MLGPKCHTADCLEPDAEREFWPSGTFMAREGSAARWSLVAEAMGIAMHVEHFWYQGGGMDNAEQRVLCRLNAPVERQVGAVRAVYRRADGRRRPLGLALYELPTRARRSLRCTQIGVVLSRPESEGVNAARRRRDLGLTLGA